MTNLSTTIDTALQTRDIPMAFKAIDGSIAAIDSMQAHKNPSASGGSTTAFRAVFGSKNVGPTPSGPTFA